MKRKNVIIALGRAGSAFCRGNVPDSYQQNEYKLVRQFGKVQRVIDQPGPQPEKFRLLKRPAHSAKTDAALRSGAFRCDHQR